MKFSLDCSIHKQHSVINSNKVRRMVQTFSMHIRILYNTTIVSHLDTPLYIVYSCCGS